MKKQAGMVNNAFIAMDAVDGAKKMGKAFKTQNTTYSDALGTTLKKQPNKMGAANAAIVNPKLASDCIDEMCKIAITLSPMQKAIIKKRKVARSLGKNIEKIDAKNTQHIKAAYDALKKKQLVRGLSEAGKASVVTVPAVAGMVGAGKGVEAVMKKFDKNRDNPENELERKVVGAGVTAGLLLNAATSKRVMKPGTTALNIIGKKSAKYPMSAIKKTKAGKVVGEFVKQVGDQGNKAVKSIKDADAKKVRDMAKQIQQKDKDMNFLKGRIYDFMNSKNPLDQNAAFSAILDAEKRKIIKDGAINGLEAAQVDSNWAKREQYLKDLFNEYINPKKASTEIDELEKLAGRKADFAKNIVIDHFFKEGLKSVPYYAAPAALGLTLNRDIKNGLRKMDEKKEHQTDNDDSHGGKHELKEKTAKLDKVKLDGGDLSSLSNEKLKRILKVTLERSADGLGRTVFPAAVTAVTGRNIMNSFKKLEDSTGQTPQEDMANKIIIQINGNPTKRNLKRQISKEIDEQYDMVKKAEDESLDIGDILADIYKEVGLDELNRQKQINAQEKLKTQKIHIGNGVKKQFRMQ